MIFENIIESVYEHRIQILSVLVSFFVFFSVIELIRKRKLREEYSLLWIFFSLVFIILSFWRDAIEAIASLLGISYPPAALFLIFFAAIFLILMQFSIVISKMTSRIQRLTQELGILKSELEEKKKKDLD